MKYRLVQEKYQDKMEPGNGAVGETQLCSVRGLVLQGQAGVTQCKRGTPKIYKDPGKKQKNMKHKISNAAFHVFWCLFPEKNWTTTTTTTTTTTGQDRTALSWEKTDHRPPRPMWPPNPAPLLFCLPFFCFFPFAFLVHLLGDLVVQLLFAIPSLFLFLY